METLVHRGKLPHGTMTDRFGVRLLWTGYGECVGRERKTGMFQDPQEEDEILITSGIGRGSDKTL